MDRKLNLYAPNGVMPDLDKEVMLMKSLIKKVDLEEDVIYYTPTLNELHDGFEYEEKVLFLEEYLIDRNEQPVRQLREVKCIDKIDGRYIEKWVPRVYKLSNLPMETRVKYLDMDDIESLGFVKTNNSDYRHEFVKDNYMIVYRTPKEEIFTTITIGMKLGSEWKILFIGDIKNKSELKVLLKQLGIM